MRRARIKAMASLPARRKATRDTAEESTDSTNPVSKESETPDVKPVVEVIQPSAEESNETVIEVPSVETAIKEELNKSLEAENAVQTEESVPVPETNTNESSKSVSEPMEVAIIKESTSPPKPTTAQESCPSSVPDATNVPPQENPTPTKVAQTRASFMRPIPRLDGGGRMRRNSIQGSGASASESEDDCRRSTSGHQNRIRNDSVSSIQSPKGHSQSCGPAGSTNAAEANTGGNAGSCTPVAKNSSGLSVRQKRKMVVSESARKLAEMRREFLLKHEHKQPDRAKLIMYDLIYYNPVTNPMKNADGPISTTRNTSTLPAPETEDDEDEDGDAAGEAMPVPQVKVGPDGSLMIDEQSLVIEHTGAKKSRQALARTEALVDEESNGSGFYKKRPKSKDWPKWETLKFYKALNTVGTDFLLMQSLFPTRTRQEIKTKYKKEEKFNQRLVEKALTYHQEFDIESLKEDLATFEETEKQRFESVKTEKRPASRQGGRAKSKKSKSRRMVAASIGEMNDTEELETSVETPSIASPQVQPQSVVEPASKPEQKRTSQRRSTTIGARARLESTSSSEDSASDTEIYQVKPTRSGRKPKVRKLQAPTINTLDNLFSDPEQVEDVEYLESPANPNPPSADEEPQQEEPNSKDKTNEIVTEEETITSNIDAIEIAEKSETVHNSLAGISQVEPGSLVIVSRESAEDPGETVLQVYMVSSDIDDGNGNGLKQNMTPVVLTPELLNTVTAGITKVAPVDVKTE